MNSYIKSEFYRMLRYKGSYLFIGICSILLLSVNVVLAAVKYSDSNFPYATTGFSFSNVYTGMSMVFLLCIMVSHMAFGNEHTNHTMKNSVSYGISRGTIYFGKLMIQIVYAMVAFIAILGVYVLSAYFLLENSGSEELVLLIRASLASLPLFLFGLAATNCFVFIIESVGAAIGAACGLMIAFPIICNLLGMRFEIFYKLSEILPWNILNFTGYDEAKQIVIYYWTSETGFRNCWALGTIQMVLITLFGFILFRKKEIK